MSEPSTDLSELMQLAGFTLGHAIWCVSDDELLIPFMLAERDGKRELIRFTAEQLEDAVQEATDNLRGNTGGWNRAAVVYDGYVTIDENRNDALIVQSLEFGVSENPIRIYLPYRPGASSGNFAILRPTLVFPTELQLNRDLMAQMLFRGIADHQQGSAVWESCYVD